MSEVDFPAQCSAQSIGAINTMVTMLIQAIFMGQCSLSEPNLWPPDYADQALRSGLDTYDFVVIGAGSAGSVVASRLSENPDWKVLVLEAGGDPPQESEVPSLFSTLSHTNFTYNYYTELNERVCMANRNRRCYLPRGRVIGGTGAINGMLYVRGNRFDYDRWLKEGNIGWGYDDVLPYFEKSVKPIINSTHPQGYVTLNEFPRFEEDIEEMIYKAAEELGVPRVRAFEEGSEIGYANVPGTIQDGQRSSTGKSHLGRVSQRPNLHVIKNAQVTKLIFDPTKERVESVEFVLRQKQRMCVKIGREVVLSAGTIDSPKILMLSGVGPKTVLKPLNIPLVKELPVGENLQDHVLVPIYIKLEDNPEQAITERQTLDNIYQYMTYKQGPLSSLGISSLIAFINTNQHSDSPYPDTELLHAFFRRGDLMGLDTLFQTFTTSEPYAKHLRSVLQNSSLLNILVAVAHPKSVGNIKLSSSDYNDPPIIDANYLADPEDSQTLLRGIHYVMHLEQTNSLQSKQAALVHIPIKECDNFDFKSDDYWRCYMKYFASTVYHHTGTVKMGSDEDSTSCVNPRLRLRGFTNVRVADASVMPHVTSCNTNGPTIMIAERAADFIKEDWSRK